MLEEVEDLFGSPDSFIGALSQYDQSLVNACLSKSSSDDFLEAWFNEVVETDTFVFGGTREESGFVANLKREIRDFICSGERYEEQRRELEKQGAITYASLISVIAYAVAPILGTSAVYVAVPVAVVLRAGALMGVRAWCSTGTP